MQSYIILWNEKKLLTLQSLKGDHPFLHKLGEMAEWSNAAVLKTVEGHTSGGSNPSLSARKPDFSGFRCFNPQINPHYFNLSCHKNKGQPLNDYP